MLDPVTKADAWPVTILGDELDAGRLKRGADRGEVIRKPRALCAERHPIVVAEGHGCAKNGPSLGDSLTAPLTPFGGRG